MSHVTACIDGSQSAPAVCDYAAWASQRLSAPLCLLHVLDRGQYPAKGDLNGSIGLGSRERLLAELATLDEQRARLAQEEGRLMLEAAEERAAAYGIINPLLRQRRGDLADCLSELESGIRLLVIGRQGEDSDRVSQLIGSHLEKVIRTLHRPILVSPGSFIAPESLMLAFDGSATTRKGVEMIAASPLFEGMPVHLLMVGTDTGHAREQLDNAQRVLESAGFETHGEIRAGEVEPTLHDYQSEYEIDLLVMGAYGHSRIRQFLVGSTTTSMLGTTRTPLLLLR